MKFGIGQPMRRHEDLRLITGRGRYTDDIILPRMTHAFVLRSPVAHAHIKRIDVAAAPSAMNSRRFIRSPRRRGRAASAVRRGRALWRFSG
jgi:CO/xanthine dehydrogenase Mo-binding subunit